MTDKRTCMHCLHHNSISRDIPPSIIQCSLIGCGVKWDDSCNDWEQDDPEKRKAIRRQKMRKNRGRSPRVRGGFPRLRRDRQEDSK
jgi:hypothetical protein